MNVKLRSVRRRFWLSIAAGQSTEEAARAVGIEATAAKRWFHQSGGVAPSHLHVQPSGRFLNLPEREKILVGVEPGESIRQIARRLGRAPSTVQRELRRNMRHQYRTQSQLRSRRGRHRRLDWDYRPSTAQMRADHLARRPKDHKLVTQPALFEQVQARLFEKLSPRQVAVELRKDFPEDPSLWVSHETIYQAIYVQGRGELRRELTKCLRTGRALRRPRRRQDRRGRIPGMVSISERPPEVEDRAIPRALGGRPPDGQGRSLRHRHPGRTLDSLSDPASPGRRLRRRASREGHDRGHLSAAPRALEVVDLGPRLGEGRWWRPMAMQSLLSCALHL